MVCYCPWRMDGETTTRTRLSSQLTVPTWRSRVQRRRSPMTTMLTHNNDVLLCICRCAMSYMATVGGRAVSGIGGIRCFFGPPHGRRLCRASVSEWLAERHLRFPPLPLGLLRTSRRNRRTGVGDWAVSWRWEVRKPTQRICRAFFLSFCVAGRCVGAWNMSSFLS